ncbi:MAG: hypothetical protein RR280_01375 [Bacteroidaceae bacterium]
MTFKSDNIGLRLKEPYKNKKDDVALNLGLGIVDGLTLSGTIVTPPLEFSAVLIGELELQNPDLVGEIITPVDSISTTGTILHLYSLEGTITHFPSTTITISGRLGSIYYGTGNIRVPDADITMSGNIRELHVYDLVGSIEVPNYPITMSGELIVKKPVFRGVSNGFTNTWNGAIPANTKDTEIVFDRSLFRKQGISLPWHKATHMGRGIDLVHHNTKLYTEIDRIVWHKTVQVRPVEYSMSYRDTVRYKVTITDFFHQAIPLPITWVDLEYHDMIRLRRSVGGVYHKAKPIYLSLESNYDLTAQKYRSWMMPWSKAMSMIRGDFDYSTPWIPPKPPEFKGSTDLNLICTYKAKSDNIYINLCNCDCFQTKYVPEKDSYIVLNEIIVTREVDGKAIHPTTIDINTDRDSWCWDLSMNIPADQLPNVMSVNGELPIIRVNVNGRPWVFLLEGKSRSRKFADTSFRVTGRSITALLTDPHAAVRTYTQPAQMTSVQLIAEELARVTTKSFEVDWQGLVAQNGWILPTGTFSYTGLTPMKAIQEIVTPVGGVVMSHPSLPKLIVKPRVPFGHWETPAIKLSVPENILVEDGTEWVQTPHANGVWVYSGSVDLAAKVDRDGTTGEKLAEPINSRVLTEATSLREAGRARLIISNPNETTTMTSAFHEELGIPPLSEVMEMTSEAGTWWGTVDSLNLNINMSGDVATVNLKVGVQRFMPESEIIL